MATELNEIRQCDLQTTRSISVIPDREDELLDAVGRFFADPHLRT
ncbi:hypothetical protein NQK81_35500 [Amycolatopsis roodepoortensis]|nr:hypothetical protein [Amycolatopsis roodepoortensis]UUV36508.1 hypothetical protein NQK81_35500 [Amycolatopsis roodepoortensis]